MKRTLLLQASLTAFALGCSDGPGAVLGTADPGLTITATAVDFGQVQIGTQVERRVEVENDGRSPLAFETITQQAPDNADFSWNCGGQSCDDVLIGPGSFGFINLVYAPSALEPDTGTIQITPNTMAVPPAVIAVSGVGRTAELEVTPLNVAFGAVVIDTTKTLSVDVTNIATIAASVAFEGDGNVAFCGSAEADMRPFCVAPTSQPISAESVFELGPGESTQLTIGYSPTANGVADGGAFTLKGCAGCPDVGVNFSGLGTDSGFGCAPDRIDFGAVNPDACVTRQVTCSNAANETVTIVDWGPTTSGGTSPEFVFQPFASLISLDEGDAATIDVRYCPTDLAADTGGFEIETDHADESRRFFRIPLSGRGGGPDIDVSPPMLDFGDVSTVAPSRRRVDIANLGIALLQVTSFSIVNTSTGAFTAPLAGRLIPPDGVEPLTVTFQPDRVGSFTAELHIFSVDQDEPEVIVQLKGNGVELPTCQFEVAPPVLDFGKVERGRRAERAIEIRNTGVAECIVTSARVLSRSDAEFSLPDTDIRSMRIQGGGSGTVRVEYAPNESIDHAGVLEFSISSASSPFNEVNLAGKGVDATLLIVPRQLDFGTVPLECRARQRLVTIYNTSSSQASLESITIEAPGHQRFTLDNLPGLPRTLDQGGQATFEVSFNTIGVAAAYSSAVQIDATFLGQPARYFVSLQGGGNNMANQVDEFEQLGQPKVDMLMVVDNSQSMSQEQASIGRSFASFIEFANAQQLDYNIAVTTTDVTGAGLRGRFVGATPATRIVRPQTQPSPEAVFGANINVGIDGSSTERGLEAAFQALSNPLIFEHNAGFLRPDAVLSLIFVSDEEDASAAPVNFYLNFFRSIKGFRNTNLFSASAIVGDAPDGCSGTGGSADAGIRYQQVAARTGGVFQSICTNNFDQALQNLSTTAFGFKSRFFLSNQPVVSTLQVEVDGAVLPQTSPDRTRNWSFDPSTNALNFTAFSTPEPGSRIRVEYQVECL